MNRTSCFAFVLAVSSLVSGCVTTNASVLGTASVTRPPVPPTSVSLYRIASQVPGRYEEIALLNSAGDSGFTNEAKMFESMKKKVGQLGANGVILDAVSEPGAGAKVAAAIFGVSGQRKGKAIAIFVFPNTQQGASPNVTTPTTPQTGSCVACAKIGKDH